MAKECKPCQEAAARRAPAPLEQQAISRRGFVGMLLATSAAFAGAAVPLAAVAAGEGRGEAALEPLAIARVDQVPVGGSVRFRFPPVAAHGVLIRLSDDQFRAYSDECTHLGCAVFWDGDRRQIICPCHKGLFDPATGAPLAGPPKRPLAGVALQIKDGVIWAVGRDAR